MSEIKVNRIDFGVVTKYFPDKGFGFVKRTFLSGSQSEIFFHIRTVKKAERSLAEKLDNEEYDQEVYFWYEIGESNKGEEVCRVLDSNNIRQLALEDLSNYAVKVEEVWTDVSKTLPIWFHGVTADLFGVHSADEAAQQREAIKMEMAKQLEKKKKEREAQRKIEEARLVEISKAKRAQSEIEEKEFENLVAEIRPLDFRYSSQVSRYIIKNKLGKKYQNISGVVQMEQNGTSWNFKGGFPPEIYSRLCAELGLKNQGTSARAVGFEPFKDL